MKHAKLIGLCLVAALALSGLVAVSAAQAEGPEWGHCVKSAKKKGNYTESNCQKVAVKVKKGKEEPDHKGEYEWAPGASAACFEQKDGNYTESGCKTVAEKKGVPDHKGKWEKTGGPKFTGEGGKGVLVATMYGCRVEPEEKGVRLPRADCTNGGRHPGTYEEEVTELAVECTSERATGEAVGSDEVANVSVRFKGCIIFGTNPCKSPGASAEEIRTEPLKGRLGYIEKAGAKVGVLLEPVAAGGRFANLECENIEANVSVGVGNATEGAFYRPEATGGYDGVISPIVPVNKMTPKFTQEYTANANRENVPSHFEGGHAELLETYLVETEPPFSSDAWSPAGEEITNVDTLEGEAEIKA